jgi:hypothetical protein
VTPTTLLGLVIFAASLGPGYIYERVAELRRPHTDRSALVESVEMVVIGSAFSLLAAMVVIAVANATGWLSVDRLVDNPARYLVRRGAAGVAAVAATVALSYIAAALAALLANRGQSVSIYPGGNPWHHVFLKRRPTDSSAFVTVLMHDGTRIAGALAAYTLEQAEEREIALVRPLALQEAGADAKPLDEDFVLVRESEITLVRGHFLPPPKQAQKASGSRVTRLIKSSGTVFKGL